jgi:hypothetical protein
MIVCSESRRKSFSHVQDFDDNGMLFYLGTHLNGSAWRNPSSLGFVTAFRSSDLPSQANATANCIFERLPSLCITGSFENSWWVIDMTPAYRVQLTGFSLRDGTNSSRTMIRNFVMQSSNDGIVWQDVSRRYRNDVSVKAPESSAFFAITRTNAFRYFRVLQTDRNAGGTFFLSLSGIEFFGTLYGETAVRFFRSNDGFGELIRAAAPVQTRTTSVPASTVVLLETARPGVCALVKLASTAPAAKASLVLFVCLLRLTSACN